MDTNLGSTPKVSVLMPVYNCSEYVQAAIESVLNQSFLDFELLIIDDASTDGTVDIIKAIPDHRIRLIRKTQNSGLIDSLNKGIELAKAAYIARMDGDDICLPGRLEKQVLFLEAHPDTAVCGTWFQIMNTGQIIDHPATNEKIRVALLENCALGHPTVMLRKSFFVKNQLAYCSQFNYCEDYDLWTRAVLHGKFANIPEVLLQYRVHEKQVSTMQAAQQKDMADRCRKRMFSYLIKQTSTRDELIMDYVLEIKKEMSAMFFKEVLNWLEQIKRVNEVEQFYDKEGLKMFIEKRKAKLADSFFNFRASFNPSLLPGLLVPHPAVRQSISLIQALKFTVKCLIFWKAK